MKHILHVKVDVFYMRGYGSFDRYSMEILKRIKKEFPLKLFLVFAYYQNFHGMDHPEVDGMIDPKGLELAPKRVEFVHRNRYKNNGK